MGCSFSFTGGSATPVTTARVAHWMSRSQLRTLTAAAGKTDLEEAKSAKAKAAAAAGDATYYAGMVMSPPQEGAEKDNITPNLKLAAQGLAAVSLFLVVFFAANAELFMGKLTDPAV